MKPRADLRELSARLSTNIRRFEQEELPLTQASINELRELRDALKEQRLALKELYVNLFQELDQELFSAEEKITQLQARMPELPPGLEDLT